MEKFFHKHSFYLAVFLFVISVLLFNREVLAVAPNSTGNPGYNRDYNPGIEHSQQGTSRKPSITPGKNSDQESNDSELNDDLSSTPSGINRGKSGFHLPPFAKVSLGGEKLQACKGIERALSNRSSHVASLAAQMVKTFSSIARGVENYYLNKAVPNGASLPNYDALVADITTKQNALTPLVDAAQQNAAGFSCTNNNPGAQMTQFRSDMQAVLQGLKDYKISVKNLIVAVRTLPKYKTGISPTATPTATLTPTLTLTPTVTP